MSRLAIFFLLVLAPALSICLALMGLVTIHENIIGWFLLVLGIAYPAGGVIYYFIRHEPFWQPARSGKATHEETSDLSFWLILPGFLVAFFASPLEWMYMPTLMPHLTWMQAVGLGLILSAVILGTWTRIHMRGLYSGHVEVTEEHHLVKSGPYRFIRHPGYTGFLLMMLGVAFGYSSLIGLAAVPVLLLPGLIYRMNVEERLLIEQFGDDYRTYSRKSKRLIPGIW